MNENQPQPREEEPRHRKPELGLDRLVVTSDDPTILAHWEEGLARWGHAFVAYTTLGTAELHSTDVLVNFADVYVASFDSVEELLREQLDSLGWSDALIRLRREEGITEDVLDWDFDALLVRVREVYDVLEEGGVFHVFNP